MRVQHDIANAMDTNQAALLVLLDMSAAFDTIDANILIDTLHNRLGVKGTPLKWFRSYLSDRCFAVKVGNSQSADHKLKYGVPHGSVLGPFQNFRFFRDRSTYSVYEYGGHLGFLVLRKVLILFLMIWMNSLCPQT